MMSMAIIRNVLIWSVAYPASPSSLTRRWYLSSGISFRAADAVASIATIKAEAVMESRARRFFN